MNFHVESTKLGPQKPGFIGSCTSSGGDYYFFEKTSRGLVKRAEVGLGMLVLGLKNFTGGAL
jgi:hypothetical protein